MTSYYITRDHITSHKITSHYTRSPYLTSDQITLERITLHQIKFTLRQATDGDFKEKASNPTAGRAPKKIWLLSAIFEATEQATAKSQIGTFDPVRCGFRRWGFECADFTRLGIGAMLLELFPAERCARIFSFEEEYHRSENPFRAGAQWRGTLQKREKILGSAFGASLHRRWINV